MHRKTLGLFAVLLLAAMAAAQQDKKAEVELQAAIRAETISGDLKRAIEQYRKVAQSKNRAVAVQALIRMADCHARLGDTEARKIYERVVREFADQPSAVATARAKLANGQAGMVIRRVWSNPQRESPGQISRDGRSFNFVSGSGMEVLDLANGTRRTLVPGLKGTGHHNSVWSPNDRQIAFGFDGEHEIRTIGADGTGMRTLARTSGDEYMFPRDWSSDGSKVLAMKATWTRASGWGQASLVWLNASDGGEERILVKPGAQGMFARVSPDGRHIAYGAPRVPGGVRAVHLAGADGSGEIVLSAHPSGEFPAGWSPDGSHVLFVSMRSGAAGLWAVPVNGGKATGEPFLVKRNLGDQVTPAGITRDGAFHYSVTFSTGDVQQLEIWAIENALSLRTSGLPPDFKRGSLDQTLTYTE